MPGSARDDDVTKMGLGSCDSWLFLVRGFVSVGKFEVIVSGVGSPHDFDWSDRLSTDMRSLSMHAPAALDGAGTSHSGDDAVEGCSGG